MSNESIIAIVSIVAMIVIGTIAFVTILAVFCYKQENIFLKSTSHTSTDITSGKASNRTSWVYDAKAKNEHKKRKRQGSFRG